MMSLYQKNCVAAKVSRHLSWVPREGAVGYTVLNAASPA